MFLYGGHGTQAELRDGNHDEETCQANENLSNVIQKYLVILLPTGVTRGLMYPLLGAINFSILVRLATSFHSTIQVQILCIHMHHIHKFVLYNSLYLCALYYSILLHMIDLFIHHFI